MRFPSTLVVFLLFTIGSMLMLMYASDGMRILDRVRWIEQTEAFLTPEAGVHRDFTAGYPGSPPILVTLALHRVFGVSIATTFPYVVYALYSLTVGAVAALLKLLQPASPWWFIGPLAIIYLSLQTSATPPSYLLVSAVPLAYVYAVYVVVNNSKTTHHMLLAGVLGYLLTLRTDTGLPILLSIAAVFTWHQGWQKALRLFCIALATGIIGNIFLWYNPEAFIASTLYKATYHYTEKNEFLLSSTQLLKIGLPGALAIVWSNTLSRGPYRQQVLPQSFALAISVTTILILIVLFSSAHRPHWLFIPFVALWNMILAGLAFDFIRHLPSRIRWLDQRIVSHALVIIILLWQIGIIGYIHTY